MDNTRPSIAIIGSGAVGSYYGGRLAEAGNNVRFLMRRDYHVVRKNGLKVTRPDGNFTLTKPTVFSSSNEIGLVDWVICALKAISIEDARKLVQPCVAADTRIIVLMNGLGLEERFANWFGAKRIFGGLAFTCINRGDPGYVHHIAHGSVTFGHFQNDPVELEKVVALWAQSKVQVSATPSLLCARWEKLCWNIPFNGLAVAAGGITTDRIISTPDLRNAARSLMEEVIMTGNTDLAAHHEKIRLNRVEIIERLFRLTETMGAYKASTMIDFMEGRLMEIEAMFGEPLRRSEILGISTPQLTLLTALLRALNEQR